MPFDALTIAAVADELRATVLGGRVQAVFLPAPLAIGLEIYARRATHYLFASAHPQHARVHLTEDKLARGTEEVTPLLLLLRKYVRDGRLAAIEQPPLERTLTFIITKADVFDKGRITPSSDSGREPPSLRSARNDGADAAPDDPGDPGVSALGPTPRQPPVITTVKIIIEIMGRYSNIILVSADGMVMEAVKHIPAEINRYRVTLPRHPYVTPPPQSKSDPQQADPAALQTLQAAAPGQPAWQSLVRAYRGVSPLLAREVIFRATGTPNALNSAVPPNALASHLAALLASQETHVWAPTLARKDDVVLEFAPYELTHLGNNRLRVASISAAIQAFYAQETVATDYQGLRQDVQKALDARRARVQRRKESLQAQQAASTGADELRTKGELLLAYAAQITPGQNEATIVLAPDEPAVRIALNPRQTAVENAQGYFKRYAQARDAARMLPPLLEEVQLDLDYLAQLQLDLDIAATQDEIREVQRALAGPDKAEADGKNKKGKPQGVRGGGKLAPIAVRSADGMEIIVGRNARQNDYVTFELGSALDLWLHARGVPGSHVIVRSGGRPVSPQTLEQAAALAAAYSAARASSSVAVDYTQRRNVRRAKGGGPGLVTYTGEKTLYVRPACT